MIPPTLIKYWYAEPPHRRENIERRWGIFGHGGDAQVAAGRERQALIILGGVTVDARCRVMYRYSLLPISSHTEPAAMDVDDEKAIAMEKPAQIEEAESPPSIKGASVPSPFEKRLVRKLDVRIMPIACILYLFACTLLVSLGLAGIDHILLDLDRSNLGNARLQGLPQDALNGDPTGELYGWVNSVFFISYVRVHRLL